MNAVIQIVNSGRTIEALQKVINSENLLKNFTEAYDTADELLDGIKGEFEKQIRS